MLEKHLVVITPREGAEVGELLLLGWTVRVDGDQDLPG